MSLTFMLLSLSISLSKSQTYLGHIECDEVRTGSTNNTQYNSVFYLFEAEYSFFITLDTCNSNYNTKISLKEDSSYSALRHKLLGECDDSALSYNSYYTKPKSLSTSNCSKCACRNGSTSCSEYWSDIKLSPNTYYIQIGGWDDAIGIYSLSIECHNITTTTTAYIPTTTLITTTTKIQYESNGDSDITAGNMVILVIVILLSTICVLLAIGYLIHIGLKNNTLRKNVNTYSSEIQNTVHKTSKISKIKFIVFVALFVFDIFDYITSLIVVNQYLSPLQCTVGETSYDLFGFGVALVVLTLIGIIFATMDTIFFMTESCCGCNVIAVDNENKQNWIHLILEVILNSFQDLLTSLMTIISAYIVGYATKELKVSIIINGVVSILYGIKNIFEMYWCCRKHQDKEDTETVIAIKEYGHFVSPSFCKKVFIFQILFSVAMMLSLLGLPSLDLAENRILLISDHEIANYKGWISYDVIPAAERSKFNSTHSITLWCNDDDSFQDDLELVMGYSYNYALPNDGTQIFCYTHAVNYEWGGSEPDKFGERTWCNGHYVDIDGCSMLKCKGHETKVCYGQCTLS